MRRWWYSLGIYGKLNFLIQVMLAVAMSATNIWLMNLIKKDVVSDARSRAIVSADGVINGMNMLMVTGMISDPNYRRLFIKKMGATDDVTELRIIRAKQVQDQFGPGLPEEQPRDEIDRRTIETKETQVLFSDNDKSPTLRVVVPFITSTNFRGTNCLSCHQVQPGTVNGAASITIDMTDDLKFVRKTRLVLWAGQLLLQLILIVTTHLLIRKFMRPLNRLRAAMESTQLNSSFENFVPVTLESNDEYEVRKLAETYNQMSKALRNSEKSMKVAALIYRENPDAIMVTDENNLIVDVNPAFTRITGYTLQDVKGKDPKVMQSGRHGNAFYVEMWRGILAGGWEGEIWDKRKDGKVYAKYAHINALYDQNGHVYRYVAQFSDITEKKQKDELIEKQAKYDPLTNLPNRRLFHDRLEEALNTTRQNGLSMALFFIDLDRFKEINDTLGHAKGDYLLKEAARRISQSVRESDTVCRLGGDEFTVLLPDFTHREQADIRAESIIRNLNRPYHFPDDGRAYYISASLGITFYPDDATDAEQLLKNADQAMYRAKSQGRNCYCYFTPPMRQNAEKRLEMVSDLHHAISSGEFMVYFQPIVELQSKKILKAEALVRWKHPVHGMVSPSEFIPLAEESGLIHEIGEWVFKESILWMKRWTDLYDKTLQVSINMSPLQFRGAGENVINSIRYLQEIGLPGTHVAVEITEGLLLNSDSEVYDNMLRLRDAGIQVTIDDFGTGYSSLSYLKKFAIDFLKIDKSFVEHLGIEHGDLALSKAIVVMAHELGIKTIGEGVETQQQLDMLAEAGCDYVQGYLFSKPLTPMDFEVLLSAQHDSHFHLAFAESTN
jgi:diguanylate cyclase (GGDEF)-like protein/PAS domain S-box-containing protein